MKLRLQWNCHPVDRNQSVCVKQIYEHQSGLTLIMHNLFSKGFSRTFVHSCQYFPVLLFLAGDVLYAV